MSAKKELYSPELKEGTVWIIRYYIEVAGSRKLVRLSKTDNNIEINSIKNLEERRKVCKEYLERLRIKISPISNLPKDIFLSSALQIAVELKRSSKPKTNKTNQDTARWFGNFINEKYGNIRCRELTFEHVQMYFDYIILDRKVSNRTHFSRKQNLGGLFSELQRRGYINENFASQIKNRPKEDTVRRPLSVKEEEILVNEINSLNKREITLTFILQRYLGIRPDEIRNLRCGAFDFKRNLIRFPSTDSKNNRSSTVTIPTDLIGLLKSFEFDRHPDSFYIIGSNKGQKNKKFMPGPDRIGEHTLTTKFHEIFKRLNKEGKLNDIKGLQLYSLKDSLAIHMLDNGVDVESAMRHFRQRDLSIFQKYVKRLGVVNEKIREMPLGKIPSYKTTT
jgi:integrase